MLRRQLPKAQAPFPHIQKPQIRTLKKVHLIEVSPGVTFPAYPQTDVAVRAFEQWRELDFAAAARPNLIKARKGLRRPLLP